MCKEKGCKIRPNYNNEGETTGLYCSAHKKEGMVNVRDKKCIHPECEVIPIFNFKGIKKASRTSKRRGN